MCMHGRAGIVRGLEWARPRGNRSRPVVLGLVCERLLMTFLPHASWWLQLGYEKFHGYVPSVHEPLVVTLLAGYVQQGWRQGRFPQGLQKG